MKRQAQEFAGVVMAPDCGCINGKMEEASGSSVLEAAAGGAKWG